MAADVRPMLAAEQPRRPGIWAMRGKPAPGRPANEYPADGQNATDRENTNLIYHQSVCVCGWRSTWTYWRREAEALLDAHVHPLRSLTGNIWKIVKSALGWRP